ncbi:hypothetical protein dsx2_1921 [Desulfovibrio sp. X2]|uniref:hypothetical protein n=1 Tax=Desulfovibrio sp. X2 TaxID=941449 RepID=UPI000358E27F|nr:hypothetical protein [Desulfovibrio sp. X2]EPR43993.1 hypothetical protein dsx2_1921 [Desulfovibrio sp. X2]
MSRSWIKKKKAQFVRDVLRDFCKASRALEEQFRRFDHHGWLDFAVLRDLLGEESNKGLLWRLKDTAHHVFRSDKDARLVGQFLDWCVGYIFHETIKLKEDAYQQQTYAPWFRDMQSQDLPREESVICQELYEVLRQTWQSMEREIKRIRFILYHCRRLFPIYLQPHRENPLLARLLFEEAELVAQVFGDGCRDLLRAVYGERQDEMYLLAAQSLRRGGWMEKAAEALGRAGTGGEENDLVLQEREIVDTWIKRLKV